MGYAGTLSQGWQEWSGVGGLRLRSGTLKRFQIPVLSVSKGEI